MVVGGWGVGACCHISKCTQLADLSFQFPFEVNTEQSRWRYDRLNWTRLSKYHVTSHRLSGVTGTYTKCCCRQLHTTAPQYPTTPTHSPTTHTHAELDKWMQTHKETHAGKVAVAPHCSHSRCHKLSLSGWVRTCGVRGGSLYLCDTRSKPQ